MRGLIAACLLLIAAPGGAADLRTRGPLPSDRAERPAASPTGEVALQTSAAPTPLLVLDPGKTEVLRVARPARTVLVGSPDVVEAVAINEKTLVLTAKSAGSTNLIILDEDGVEFFRRLVQVGQPPDPPPPPAKPIVVYSGEGVRTYLCQPICNLPPEAPQQAAGLLPLVPAGGAFPSCDVARAAGRTSMRRGEAGYAPHLDADNDGVACEPPPVPQ